MAMKTLQVRLPNEHIRLLDRMVRKGRFPNRSEAVRHSVGEMLFGPQRK